MSSIWKRTAVVAVCGAAAWFVGRELLRRLRIGWAEADVGFQHDSDLVDMAGEDSFPASDPPARTPVSGTGTPVNG